MSSRVGHVSSRVSMFRSVRLLGDDIMSAISMSEWRIGDGHGSERRGSNSLLSREILEGRVPSTFVQHEDETKAGQEQGWVSFSVTCARVPEAVDVLNRGWVKEEIGGSEAGRGRRGPSER